MPKESPTDKILDRHQISSQWKSRGFSCSLWVDPPGQVWKNYIHDTDELLMVIEGSLEIEMNGEKIRPEIGQEVLIPAKTRHTVSNLSRKTSRWLYGYKKN